MDEVAQVLKQITGLRVEAFPAATITPPAGYVSYPLRIQFDETYQRGSDQFVDLTFVLLAGEPGARPTRNVIAAWAHGDGPLSVKKRMEDHTWASCDDVTVNTCEFDVETIAGVAYLAAIFKATVEGPGGD
jgi:hypothetical protein